MIENEFWNLVREHAAAAAKVAAPPFVAYAKSTGDAAANDTVGSITVSVVDVWLNGAEEIAGNKVQVIVPVGTTAPAASGQLWLVLLPNYQAPGLLAFRIA